jgi:ribose transport system permease protein
VFGFPPAYRAIGTSKVAGIPTPAIIALVVFVLLHLMLTRTRLGRKMFAVGGNAEAAAYAGIKVGRIKLVALMLSGLTSGIGGLILSSRLDAGNGVFGAGDLLGRSPPSSSAGRPCSVGWAASRAPRPGS